MQNLSQQIKSLLFAAAKRKADNSGYGSAKGDAIHHYILGVTVLDVGHLVDQPLDKRHRLPPCREEHKGLCMGLCPVIEWLTRG